MNIADLKLTDLKHTWILDLDGTIVKHNGYKIDGYDTLLDGTLDFYNQIPKEDTIIILTAREEKYREITINFLKEKNLRYDNIIFNVPKGERILINDNKPDGQKMAYEISLERDKGLNNV